MPASGAAVPARHGAQLLAPEVDDTYPGWHCTASAAPMLDPTISTENTVTKERVETSPGGETKLRVKLWRPIGSGIAIDCMARLKLAGLISL
jgi:hypothetical protein